MQTGVKQLEAYERVIQNLLTLEEEAKETRPKEAEAIEVILLTLSALRDRLRDNNIPPVYSILQGEDADVMLAQRV